MHPLQDPTLLFKKGVVVSGDTLGVKPWGTVPAAHAFLVIQPCTDLHQIPQRDFFFPHCYRQIIDEAIKRKAIGAPLPPFVEFLYFVLVTFSA